MNLYCASRIVLRLLFFWSGALGERCLAANAHDTARADIWKTNGNAGLNITNIGFSNWAAGGQNTFSVSTLLALVARYRSPDSTFFWDNTAELAYGLARVNGSPLRKSDDRIILLSKLTRRVAHNSIFGYSAQTDFRTQFSPSFNYVAPAAPLIAQAFAPAFLLLASGIDYKPNDKFFAFLSPISGRGVFVANKELAAQGAFGVDSGSASKIDFGTTFTASLKAPLAENVSVQTRLNLFSAYRTLSSLVVTWETLTLFKVNKFINVAFDTQLLYDERIPVKREDESVGPATQFRHTLAIGFNLPFLP